MSELVKGRNVRVEVGITEGAPKTVTAVTLSDPGVAVSASHGLVVGSVGYLDDVEGMSPIDGQAVRVSDAGSPSVDNFGLETIDTTDMPAFTSGVFVPVTAWATLAQSTQYQLGGGAPKTEDVGTLIDTTEKLETIKLAAETVSIDIRSLTEDNAALAWIRRQARKATNVVFRITLNDGSQRIFRGQPSIPGESVTQGATGTGQLTVTIKGQICYLVSLT
jgi:hypothetical protein